MKNKARWEKRASGRPRINNKDEGRGHPRYPGGLGKKGVVVECEGGPGGPGYQKKMKCKCVVRSAPYQRKKG